MSIDLEPTPSGVPELTELGKRIEMLRIERGLSKQSLARAAGASRQQLWRVMTGKSELTGPLRQRLSEALRVDPTMTTRVSDSGALSEFLADVMRLETALRALPGGDDGRRVKRALLNALEDLAVERGVVLAATFFDLRRRVLHHEL